MPPTPTQQPQPVATCPECSSGKCANCTVEVLDADDQWGLCTCPSCGGGMAGFVIGGK